MLMFRCRCRFRDALFSLFHTPMFSRLCRFDLLRHAAYFDAAMPPIFAAAARFVIATYFILPPPFYAFAELMRYAMLMMPFSPHYYAFSAFAADAPLL